MKEIDKKYMASYTKLHYSQTTNLVLNNRNIALYPYKITLLSNDKRDQEQRISLCTHTKLHYSQTSNI